MPSATLFDTKEISADTCEFLLARVQSGVDCLEDAQTDEQQPVLKLGTPGRPSGGRIGLRRRGRDTRYET